LRHHSYCIIHAWRLDHRETSDRESRSQIRAAFRPDNLRLVIAHLHWSSGNSHQRPASFQLFVMRMSCVSQWFGYAVVTFPVTVAYGDELRHANLLRSATKFRAQPNVPLQPRRPIIAAAAVGCKRMLAGAVTRMSGKTSDEVDVAYPGRVEHGVVPFDLGKNVGQIPLDNRKGTVRKRVEMKAVAEI
jgi:hypothetical protein